MEDSQYPWIHTDTNTLPVGSHKKYGGKEGIRKPSFGKHHRKIITDWGETLQEILIWSGSNSLWDTFFITKSKKVTLQRRIHQLSPLTSHQCIQCLLIPSSQKDTTSLLWDSCPKHTASGLVLRKHHPKGHSSRTVLSQRHPWDSKEDWGTSQITRD